MERGRDWTMVRVVMSPILGRVIVVWLVRIKMRERGDSIRVIVGV